MLDRDGNDDREPLSLQKTEVWIVQCGAIEQRRLPEDSPILCEGVIKV